MRLPNPYLDTECIKYHKYIDYNINSKFKSKYADYINSKSRIISKKDIKYIKTFNESNKKIAQHIYFTKTNNKNK